MKQFLKVKNSLLDLEKDFIELKDFFFFFFLIGINSMQG